MILTAISIGAILVTQSPARLPTIEGRYVSKEDKGVLVFRGDGTFGYKFACKIDFYSTNHLPPYRAKFRILSESEIQLTDLPEAEYKFKIEIRDFGKILVLTRFTKNGHLPMTSIYHRD